MNAAAQPLPMSGVGVLDKASIVLSVVEREAVTLAELVARSGLPRPTAHRIAVALERLELLARDFDGRFVLGPRLGLLSVEAQRDRLVQAAPPVLADLRSLTGLDARLLRRRGALQICVATSPSGWTDAVPVGTSRPAKSGPAAQVLLAWEDPEELYEGLRGARFNAAQLAQVRRRGWAHGPDSMAPGSAAYAVPVRTKEHRVVAALALSGPLERVPATPSRTLSGALIDSAASLSDALRRTRGEFVPAGFAGT
ncbi:IclR family transcriptional regulator [Streptomyces xantholiticus]|uniref:DoxR n=2 Tax=Streptomyces TaxID=1883 RepID=I6VEY1_STRC0|nr:DoxR [Streptomyces peucetius subsp. caesius ATCC 27952]